MANTTTLVNLSHAGPPVFFQFSGSGTVDDPCTFANLSVNVGSSIEVSNDVGNPIPVNGTVAIGAGSAVIGHVIVDSGTVTAVTAITNALPAGTNLLGKTGIDQTTPGTTNAVAVITGQAGVAGGSGVVGATTQRVVLATDVALPAGINLIGKTGIDQTTDGTTNAIRELKSLGAASVATRLCYPTAAGSASLSKTKWPSTYTVALPSIGSGAAGVANLTESAAVVGGVFSPAAHWGAVLLDFAAVSAADATMVIEIGKLTATGCLPQKIASVSLKTITTSGTFTANFDPFTGAAQATTTFRLFDLATITGRGNLGQLLTAYGGTEDDTPCQLLLDVSDAPYYYLLITTLGVTGPVTVCITPVP